MTSQEPTKPFIVGFSGCQGSGKTTICETIATILRQEPYNLSVVVFSLDDLYLTRDDQVKVAASNPGNRLLQLRGQFGSHDLELAQRLFQDLLDAHIAYLKSPTSAPAVGIPRYDKSLNQGLGDRVPESEWTKVFAPYDIIIFEGWSLGFKHLPDATLPEVYNMTPQATKYSLEDVTKINTNLKAYENSIYPYFDIFCHMAPTSLENVYTWRLEQEHNMISTRGVQGMSDEQVRTFVDTYMPAYGLFMPRLERYGFYQPNADHPNAYEGPVRADGGYSAPMRHLKLVIDLNRNVVESTRKDVANGWVAYNLPRKLDAISSEYASSFAFGRKRILRNWSAAVAVLLGAIAVGYHFRREVVAWYRKMR
jgi:D-glycerate 3-kinase